VLTILLVSTADTELLAAAASGAGYLTANPARVTADEVPALAARADLVVLRLLGGRNAWAEGVAALVAAGKPLVALGGEAAPDAELMALSTVPAGVATEALAYLREGGPENLRELARFLSDTVFLTGEGFLPPHPTPSHGPHPLPDSMIVASSGQIAPHSGHDHENAPVVGVVFYRAHELAGNTVFVDTLCEALAQRGATPLPVFCASLRSADAQLAELLSPADAVITTVLAAGGSAAADATGESDWDAGLLASLDVPVLQGLCLTSSRAQWEASNAALAPIDAAMQVAIPEFDGRVITVPFSFKEEGPGRDPALRRRPRTRRPAGWHRGPARPPGPHPERRQARRHHAFLLSHQALPGRQRRRARHARLGRRAAARHARGRLRPRRRLPEDGDTLIHALIAAGRPRHRVAHRGPAPRRTGPGPARRLPPFLL
jgi:cobaltochelatase CobN